MDVEVSKHSPHALARELSRWMLIMMVALMAGAMVAQSVDAKKMDANGVSIATRVQAQNDLCDIGGGTFESKETVFGSTITTCTGGDGGAGTCVNTTQSTNCHPPRTRGSEDVYTPPTGGVFEEPATGGLTPVVATGATVNSRQAQVSDDDRDQPDQGKKRHGKGKQSKGGKRGR